MLSLVFIIPVRGFPEAELDALLLFASEHELDVGLGKAQRELAHENTLGGGVVAKGEDAAAAARGIEVALGLGFFGWSVRHRGKITNYE
ncbi:hypothetical protein AW736_13920 [Termitidicoccus mucosus]|uniref:Uncharacterized protein n=1 Tax=Termitidicoccus mucosus TaxID=1184151 RepID=A0A178IH74_9BACT|nr:hypothetical protein AW736_13920 [Opitutaceae bacterium TSB47]